ncbi:putative hsp90-like protein [Diaporthe ampelina]|uniref:Putative hsp90-like protein n=1 Tax=Diaporthe ampelina TaxID=1214573 RepID=A0A0G2FHG4_9PEZI|nr:putative hsp90-like protein [Diaporthe ampelina]
MTDEGHLVITGRDGTLQRCEDEPIHAPGAVQGFGLMLAIREEADGRFTVRYASENSKRIIGYTPLELFRLNNFTDILTEEQADNLLDHIDFIRDEDADPAINGPEVFSMSIRPPKKRSMKLWCAIHAHSAHPDLIICEFELDDDHDFPLRPDDERTPDLPADTLRSNPTMDELTDSTEISSKPLRVLRSARKRRGEAGAMQVFDIMSQVQEQLASATNLDRFLKILVGIVKELTGFHRVMIYQFDASFNGKVVTELVDPVHTKDLYKGLHFPASDIPKQARDLYKLNKVRLLYDRDQETARLVCRSKEDLDIPLDMTHSYLRAMSPIHVKYLRNMAVRSSMSISINAFNELWGLIACHSYGAKGMRVSFPIRKMCRLVGDTVSRNIERLSYASRLQARKLINTVPTDKNPSGYIIASSDDLLRLFDADFGMLSIKGETKFMGKVDHSQEALAMLEYLRLRKFSSVLSTQDVKVDFPDLHYPPGFHFIAGLLYVPLSVGGSDFIVFYRKGQVREVKWAGNPYEKVIQEGTQNYLEPRKSFQVWHETILGKCREWSEEQIETAAVLCLVYGKFIEVWRQKEAALQNSRLTKLLLANSAHEVRTPLNAIINYLEIALEGSLDQETRDNLARSHSASKSLIYVINDLLDLTQTEEGNNLVKDEIFDLIACVREATDPFRNDAKRKGIDYEVVEHPGLPKYVCGDQRRLRQAVSNVTANAVQHTSEGYVKIEVYSAEVQDTKVRVEIIVQDTGRGMSDSQLDALFRELEQVSTEDINLSEEEQDTVKGKSETLGLGLAVVARIVRNMDGQLRLKSEAGKGSRFIIQLSFEMPPNDSPGDTKQEVSANVDMSDPPVGLDYITDTKTPIRPVKIADEYQDQPEAPAQPSETSGVLFELADEASPTKVKADSGATTIDGNVHKASKPESAKLRVLVAEDDPINMKILRKRLEKAGHTVHHTVNGEDCSAAYRESADEFDVVLMDMQMPLMDGLTATKTIREIEHSGEHHRLSAIASNHGFDGWILKPIDFKRLEALLFGIIDDHSRNNALYVAGQWERGGWFRKRLELPSQEKAKDAPPLRAVELHGNEINAARDSMS